MASTLMVLLAIDAVLLIIMVLLQFGKGAEAGLMQSAGSETVLSSSSQGNILSKITTVLAVIFLGLSLWLARIQDSKNQKSLFDNEAPVSRPLNSDAEAAKQAAPTSTDAAATQAPAAQAATPATAPAAAPANAAPQGTK